MPRHLERDISNIPVCCLVNKLYKHFHGQQHVLSSISMQAQNPVREDDLVASHKVASVKIAKPCMQ